MCSFHRFVLLVCLRYCVAGLAMNEIVLCWPVNDFVRFHRYVWQYLYCQCVSSLLVKHKICIDCGIGTTQLALFIRQSCPLNEKTTFNTQQLKHWNVQDVHYPFQSHLLINLKSFSPLSLYLVGQKRYELHFSIVLGKNAAKFLKQNCRS